MNYELIIHGCPNGQQFAGQYKPHEAYLKTFYIEYHDKHPSLLVEFRNARMFYSYIIKDIKGASGRSGGYFAITLSLDYYCPDLLGIYALFNNLFQNIVKGKILRPDTDGSYTFLSASLDDFEPMRQRMELKAGNYLQNLEPTIFSALNNFAPARKTERISIADCATDSAIQLVPFGTRLDISMAYPSKKDAAIIAEKDRRIQQIQSTHSNSGSRISKLSEQITSLSDENNQLHIQIENASQHIEELESANQRLEAENAEQKKIIDPILKLIGQNRASSTPEHAPKPKWQMPSLKEIAYIAGISLVLILIGYFMGSPRAHSSAGSDAAAADTTAVDSIAPVNTAESVERRLGNLKSKYSGSYSIINIPGKSSIPLEGHKIELRLDGQYKDRLKDVIWSSTPEAKFEWSQNEWYMNPSATGNHLVIARLDNDTTSRTIKVE